MKADWVLLIANTSEGPPHKNKSLICVPLNVPGKLITDNIGTVYSAYADKQKKR